MQLYEQGILLPTESGEWTFSKNVIVPTCYPTKPIFMWAGWTFNRETWAPDTPDPFPSAGHDMGYEHKVDAYGKPFTRLQVDVLFYVLNSISHEKENRDVAARNYKAVRIAGYPWWAFPLRTPEIPLEAQVIRCEMLREWEKTDKKEILTWAA